MKLIYIKVHLYQKRFKGPGYNLKEDDLYQWTEYIHFYTVEWAISVFKGTLLVTLRKALA